MAPCSTRWYSTGNPCLPSCPSLSHISLILFHAPWFSSETLALYKSLTYLLTFHSLPYLLSSPSPLFPLHSLPLEVGPIYPARGSGEHRKLTQRGQMQSPSQNQCWYILALKSDIQWQQFQWFSWKSSDLVSAWMQIGAKTWHDKLLLCPQLNNGTVPSVLSLSSKYLSYCATVFVCKIVQHWTVTALTWQQVRCLWTGLHIAIKGIVTKII